LIALALKTVNVLKDIYNTEHITGV